jgi:MerR family transcriptional regulator, light-induced transcriptional regulator
MEPARERDETTTEARLTISSVSSMLGIPIPTIRSWERRYGYPTPHRTDGRHRRYSTAEVDLLRALRDEITRGHPAREAVDMVRRGRPTGGAERDGRIDDFLTSAMRLDPIGLRRALDSAMESIGVEAAIRDVGLPAMREMGSRWRAGTCDVANEHLATEAVRVWLARMSAMSPAPFRPGSIVLACGPKDLHSVGLEAFGVLLGRRGWAVRTLGPLTPAASLVTALRPSAAWAAVVTSQRNVTRRAAVEAIAAAAAVPGVRAFYAGDAFSSPASRRNVPGTFLGDDVVGALETMESASPDRRRSLAPAHRVGA